MSEFIKFHYWIYDLCKEKKGAVALWTDILLRTDEDGYWTFDIENYCRSMKIERKDLNELLRFFKGEDLIEYERIGRKTISVFLIDWDSYQC